MSDVRIESQTMTDIADSIRSKLGVETTYKPSDMAGAIESIPTGVTPSGTISITQNGTHDVTNYASANVNVPVNTIYYTADGRQYTENITFPNTITSFVANYGYKDCVHLQTVDMSALTVAPISSCFQGCANLTSVILPTDTGDVDVNTYVFSGCTSLTSINIPVNFKRINTQAFNGCTGLLTVIIEGITAIVGTNNFRNCTNLVNLTLPATLTSVSNANAFAGCSALKKITLGQGFLATVSFSASTQFTADDIIAMFNKLGEVPSGETRTFTLGATNLAKLTAEQKAIATDKGWTLA